MQPSDVTQPSTYSQRLRSLMETAHLTSFKALSQTAGVSEWQVQQLRQGKVAQMRVETVHRFSQVLGVPLAQLLQEFSDPSLGLTSPSTGDAPKPSSGEVETSTPREEVAQLRQEYDRLQAQLATQRDALHQEFQRAALDVLESLLTYLPTAIHATKTNPDLPATRLLTLLAPLDRLLESWGVEAIGSVGEEVAFDPQQHQLQKGMAEVGDRVRLTHVGYRQGGTLLYRAKVVPL